MNRLKTALLSLMLVAGLLAASSAQAAPTYEETLAGWKSYEDVGKWMADNFSFNSTRLDQAQDRVQAMGPKGLLAHAPEKTFASRQGYCVDAAHFAIQSLNRVNPEYNARYIFIRNGSSATHHWVAGFMVGGKIMVMDYGPGNEWRAIRGIHGPYDSLQQYQSYLRSQGLKRFSPDEVAWRNMPGTID